MTKRIAVYAGSFDPMTMGHLSLARRGATLFDEVILAIGENPSKRYLLDFKQRTDLARAATADIDNIRVTRFSGLLVDYCRSVGAGAILRGLRTASDFHFEYQIGVANMDMAPDIETVFFWEALRTCSSPAHWSRKSQRVVVTSVATCRLRSSTQSSRPWESGDPARALKRYNDKTYQLPPRGGRERGWGYVWNYWVYRQSSGCTAAGTGPETT
jgi:pantetheine-phosphate adenylyltransferase